MKKGSGFFKIFGVLIIAIAVIALIYEFSKDKEKKDHMSIASDIDHIEIPSAQETEERIEKTIAKLNMEIQEQIDFIDHSFNSDIYNGSIEVLKLEIGFFNEIRVFVEKGEASENDETIALSRKLKEKLNLLQAKEFPILRKKYQAITASNLWEHDIYVNVSGKRNTILEFTGGIFAANKNIKDFYTEAKSVFELFRFKQVRFKWYKGASEYTYYKMETPSDKDPVFYSM